MTPLIRIGFASVLVLLACEAPTRPSRTGGIELRVVATPAGTGALDAGVVRVQGPTSLTRNVTPGTTVTIDNLEPGLYTVAAEGFIAGEVTLFGQTAGLNVTAGPAKPATLTFASFAIPAMNSLPPVVTTKTFAVGFNSVPDAVEYRVETATDQFFTNNFISVTTAQSPANATVPSDGTYYVRVRAIDPYQQPGRASAPQSLQVVSQLALDFLVQPSNVSSGTAITPGVRVRARDALGNTSTGFTGNVTVALETNPAGAILSGNKTVAAVAGVATFSTLSLDQAGTGYTLRALATGLTDATSGNFSVLCNNCWTTRQPLPSPNSYFGVGVVSGVQYAVGGLDVVTSNALATVIAYDPVTNSWTIKSSMPTPRSGLGVGVVNGILYAVGGYGNGVGNTSSVATVEAYDPATNSWSSMAPMPTARSSFGVGVVNGTLYAVGGQDTSSTTIGLLATVEAYNPVTNSWTTRAPLPTPSQYLGVGVVNGVLYAVGGFGIPGYLATVQAYDPVTNSWTTKAPLPAPRGYLGVGVVNGVLYAVGGSQGSGQLATVTAYDPVTDIWTTKSSMPTPRIALGVGVVNGILYAVGGIDDSLNDYATVEAYQP